MAKPRRYNGCLYELYKRKGTHWVVLFDVVSGPFTTEDKAEQFAHKLILEKLNEKHYT